MTYQIKNTSFCSNSTAMFAPIIYIKMAGDSSLARRHFTRLPWSYYCFKSFAGFKGFIKIPIFAILEDLSLPCSSQISTRQILNRLGGGPLSMPVVLARLAEGSTILWGWDPRLQKQEKGSWATTTLLPDVDTTEQLPQAPPVLTISWRTVS